MNSIFNLFSGKVVWITNIYACFVRLIKQHFIRLQHEQQQNINKIPNQLDTKIEDKHCDTKQDTNINAAMDMDKIMYNDNPVNERRITIAKYLSTFLPDVLAKLISDYDYHFEKKIYTFSNKFNLGQCFAVLPDKRIIGNILNTLRIWDPETGNSEIYAKCSKTLSCVSAFSNGRIIGGLYDGTLILWNTQKDYIIFRGHTAMVSDVIVLIDGRVVTGSYDKTLKVWNMIDPSGTCDITFTEHSGIISQVFALSDGRIVSSSPNETIKNWDSKTGMCNFTIKKEFSNTYTFTVSSDDRIISIIDSEIFKIYNAKSGLCDIIFKHNLFNSLNFNERMYIMCELPDGRIIVRMNNNTLYMIDLKDVSSKETLHVETPETIQRTAILPDGRIIMITYDQKLKILY
jgi:WD40 repeat protein